MPSLRERRSRRLDSLFSSPSAGSAVEVLLGPEKKGPALRLEHQVGSSVRSRRGAPPSKSGRRRWASRPVDDSLPALVRLGIEALTDWLLANLRRRFLRGSPAWAAPRD